MANQQMKEPLVLDLVGNEKLKCPETVKHVAVCVPPHLRDSTLADILAVHGKKSLAKSIVFVPTKRAAGELADHPGLASTAVQLHGDISQAGREQALAGKCNLLHHSAQVSKRVCD